MTTHNCHGFCRSHKCYFGEGIIGFVYSHYCCQRFLDRRALESTISSSIPCPLPSCRPFHSLLKPLNRVYSRYTPVKPLRRCILSSMQDQPTESYQLQSDQRGMAQPLELRASSQPTKPEHAKPNPGHLVIVMATSKRQPSRHTPLSQAHRTTSTERLHTTKHTTR